MKQADVELLASYWTLSGGAIPHAGPEHSTFEFKERVEAAAHAGFTGMGFWHADLEHVLQTRSFAEMKRILDEIQSGKFAREWILENRANAPAFKAMRRRERSHPLEEVGRRLRRLMSWINAKEV